ncbi:hypothetical protein Bca52824_010230 [Brassica carinata]|uniref:Uncharacterized protein n=1 Tax=Brassica carinata TaxID=52824 RepID=A0A8X8BAI3_BRACI|nr:hypothetical protein Bca52824_010230 [Brassica carinata]
MDPNISLNGFEYLDESLFLDSSPSFDFDRNPSFLADPTEEPDENDSSTTLLRYVTQILMEESVGDKQSMFYDSLALRKTEEMLQQVITDSKAHSFTTSDASGSIGSSSSNLPVNEIVVKSMFSDAESDLQFRRGLEEARKFLPNSDQWVFNLERPVEVIKEEMGLRVKKSHEREFLDLEEVRSSKQSATNVEDVEVIVSMVLNLPCTYMYT